MKKPGRKLGLACQKARFSKKTGQTLNGLGQHVELDSLSEPGTLLRAGLARACFKRAVPG